jgi:hypothetical protein
VLLSPISGINTLPLYQTLECKSLSGKFDVSTTELPSQNVKGPSAVIVGTAELGFTVIPRVVAEETHPLKFVEKTE